MSEYICKIQNITKEFPGVKALKGVSFNIKRGEIHAIIGENGAGKSTLMNILSGVFSPTSGELIFDDKPIRFTSTRAAQHAGIAMIHQELSLAPYMSVSENVFQGRMVKNRWGFIDGKTMNKKCTEALNILGAGYIKPTTLVKDMSVSQRQMVEIAKAISLNAKLLIMDEPTSSLTTAEIEFLLKVMRVLREEGVSILFISHKLEEVLEIADAITVMRDGEYIVTLDPKKTDLHEMISCMVGRSDDLTAMREFIADMDEREVVLDCQHITVPGYVKDVSFRLHKGEVLGLTGLVGAGRSELLKAIFGYYPNSTGRIFLNGKELKMRHCSDAIREGIGLVPENRKEDGLFLRMPVLDNMTMIHARSMSKKGFMNLKRTTGIADEYVKLLSIKTPNLAQLVMNLSGGNQQKTIIARWLMHKPQIMLLDEPTHGIDVGAKTEIYELIDQIAKQGISIILLSSELPEVIRMCDRIMVMHHGELRGILNHQDVSQIKIMNLTLNDAAASC